MPILCCSFTPFCQNMKILQIKFYDVITSVLYTKKIIHTLNTYINKVIPNPLIAADYAPQGS